MKDIPYYGGYTWRRVHMVEGTLDGKYIWWRVYTMESTNAHTEEGTDSGGYTW